MAIIVDREDLRDLRQPVSIDAIVNLGQPGTDATA
jgi:hypothetical protein